MSAPDIEYQDAVAKASATAIPNALAGMKTSFRSGRWLERENPYEIDTINKLKVLRDKTVNDNALIEYVAGSTVVHLLEGWGYLSSALHAISHGDVTVSRHLAYYGELRACMSLLANQGIGVFDRDHVVIDDHGGVTVKKIDPTHQFSWRILQEWARSEKSGIAIGECISAFHIPMREWMQEFLGGADANRVTGVGWIDQWGIDLQQFSGDREMRNQVSYRPHFDFTTARFSPSDSIRLMNELWNMSDPSDSPFEALDRFLVREALRTAFNTRELSMPYEERVEQTLHGLGFPQQSPAKQFLLKDGSNGERPPILEFASSRVQITGAQTSRDIICRAFLLLRLATAMTSKSLRSAMVTIDDLSFWWKHLGVETGLWSRSDGVPDELFDGWLDIELVLEELNDWVAQSPDADCMRSFCDSHASRIGVAARLEPAALWGLS